MASLLDPSTLFFQFDGTRRRILIAYWIIILLAIPLWWNTTSIQRLSLPSSRVNAQAHTTLAFPTTVVLDSSFEESSVVILKQLLEARVPKDLSVIVQSGTQATEPGQYLVSHSSSDEAIISGRQLLFPSKQSLTQLADTLTQLLAPYPALREHRVAQYAPRYRLAFTLLNEDAAAGHFMRGWDIKSALHRHIEPVITAMSLLHNFTIESQVQFHAPLAFELQPHEDGSFGVTSEDLTVFINSAEWTLSSSSSNDPVLHFVLFVPSANNRPLNIMSNRGSSISDSSSGSNVKTVNTFLIPQWGGVVIYNPASDEEYMTSAVLDAVFPSFSHHLLSLLGLPRLSSDLICSNDISDWQLDALIRRRALENNQGAKDILQSTVKLVDQIENMPVGPVVQNDVEAALSALEKLHGLSSVSLVDASKYSAEAVTIASRAFFNPEMLALLYFPPEHRYAVYTPLFASAVIPLFAAAVREIVAWRKQKRQVAPQS